MGSTDSRVPTAHSEEVYRRFLFGLEGPYFAPLDVAIQRSDQHLRSIADALRGNLQAAIDVASLPFTMSHASVIQRRWQAIHTAERIRSRGLDDVESREQVALDKARERLSAELDTDEGKDSLASNIVADLEAALKDQSFRSAGSELLRQVLVMTWGAFEVFVTDTATIVLNQKPDLAVRLLTSDPVKRHFPSKNISIEQLATHQFDAGQSMGSILFGERRLDSLPMIRDVLSAIAPGFEQLHRKLSDQALWLLWQRRHVIVHQRAVVDKTYIANTSDTLPLGSRLEVTSREVEASLNLVRDVSVELLNALMRDGE